MNTVRSKRNIPQALDVNISKDELREEIQKEWRKEMLLEDKCSIIINVERCFQYPTLQHYDDRSDVCFYLYLRLNWNLEAENNK